MPTSRWLLLLGATALVSVAATIFTGRVLGDEEAVPGASRVTMQSSVLGEDRECFVHLPEGYAAAPAARYPVLYVLDGTSQSGHTAESAGLLARVGLIPPMIVVGVPSVNSDTRNRDYTPPEMRLDTDAPAGPKGAADRFLSFLRTEVIVRIERDYRTTRRACSPAGRAVACLSSTQNSRIPRSSTRGSPTARTLARGRPDREPAGEGPGCTDAASKAALPQPGRSGRREDDVGLQACRRRPGPRRAGDVGGGPTSAPGDSMSRTRTCQRPWGCA